MKTVLVFRHGKSDWDANGGDDHARPLAKRGIKAAKRMGRYLASVEQVPDRVFTSSAVRALETVRLAADAGAWPCAVEVTDDLYEASPADVLEIVRRCPADAESVLLAGHEPTCSSFVAKLTGGTAVRLPTAALARVDLAIDRWTDAAFGDGVLIWLVPPRLISKSDA